MTYRRYPRRPRISEYVNLALTYFVFSALEYNMYIFAGFLPSPVVQVCPKNDDFERFYGKGHGSSQSAFSACGAGLRAQEALCKSNEMREMTLSLLRFRVKSRNFVYARARNEVNSRDFLNAMYARARNAVVSIACKGSSAVNVVHTMVQKFCDLNGVLWCMQGSKCRNFQGLNILQFPGFSARKGSTCFNLLF